MEWIFCFRKGNKGRSNKIEKRILPSDIQRIDKTENIKNLLKTFCDREDDDSSEKSFVSARFTERNRRENYDVNSLQKNQKKKIFSLANNITDSSSEDSFHPYKNVSTLSKKNKQSKNNSDKKANSIGDICSSRKVSRSFVKEKKTLKKNRISSDSNDDSSDSSDTLSNKTKKYTRHNRSEKIVKPKTNNHTYSSDSESDENDTSIVSSVFKRTSKGTRQQNKKMDNSYAKSRDRTKQYDSDSSESEGEKYIKQNRRKRSEMNRLTSHSNDEQTRDKLLKQRLSNIQENDSDNSSSKEFQKIKLQKVNRNKYSMRQLANLEIDYTEAPRKNSANDMSDKDINAQSNENFNDIIMDCKKTLSNFQMYIESIEQLFGKKNEAKLRLRLAEKIEKVKTTLGKKQENLITSRNRKKSATKRSNKVVSNNEESSEEHEKHIEVEDKQDGNKAVSECDSEEIFSADETRSPQKMQATRHKVDLARTEKSLNNNETDIDDEDRMSMNKLKNNDKNNVDMQDDLAASPILSLKEKINIERSSKNNRRNNETQSFDENKTEIEDSPPKSSRKKVALENDETNRSKRNIINDSMDMFDTSLEDAEKNRTEVETNCDKEELLQTSKDKILDPCENSLQNKVLNEKERIFLEEEKDLSSQGDQGKMVAISVTNEKVHNDSKTSRKTDESIDDAEALAKTALLATDSDTMDHEERIFNGNVPKSTQGSFTDDTNRIKKKNESEDNDSDVNSVSTIILSTFLKNANTDAEKDITEANNEAKRKSDDRSNEKSHQEMSLSEDEKAAKKSLLESNSDDSAPLLVKSGKFTDKKLESDSFKKNAEAKLSLLASSSEDSSSEQTLSEIVNVSKSIKRNHEPESDKEHIASRLKKRRLKLDENHYYKNDKKLRMSCEVHLTRLSTEILKCYSRALKKSREYLEHKELKRYQVFSVQPMSIVLHRLTYSNG